MSLLFPRLCTGSTGQRGFAPACSPTERTATPLCACRLMCGCCVVLWLYVACFFSFASFFSFCLLEPRFPFWAQSQFLLFLKGKITDFTCAITQQKQEEGKKKKNGSTAHYSPTHRKPTKVQRFASSLLCCSRFDHGFRSLEGSARAL